VTFSIVTPSWRSQVWLRLCLASVADQQVPLEHLVHDACSDDGTLEWLPHDTRASTVSEPDRGMYDAVNRGLRRATGDITAYLNCDEQYLPGALSAVAAFFTTRPDIDVVFGDCLIVDAQGAYLCERQALIPTRLHSLVSGNLSFLTAGLFFRRRMLDAHDLYFNTDYRDLGDAEWTIRLVASGVRMATLGMPTSIFTETGANLSLSANAARERDRLRHTAPAWARTATPAIVAAHRLRRWRAGHYQPQTRRYAIYTQASPNQRITCDVSQPTALWRGRMALIGPR
jgi:glycosyltransferase involved in cell wall biosynthesis